MIRCTESLNEEEHQKMTVPLSIFIPSTTTTTATILHEQTTKQPPSPTDSSSRSTVVRSQSSSDVESPNEQILTRTLIPQEQNEQQQETVKEENVVPIEESSLKNESSPSDENLPSSTTTTTPNNNEEEDDYIKCSLETVYTSTEMALSPPQQRPSASQQTDNQYAKEIINEFHLLKNQYEQTKGIQHDLVVHYHQTVLKVITSLQQANQAHQEQIEQFQSDIVNHIQDNETLKIQYDLSEQSKHELTTKCSTLEINFDNFRRASDIETSQIVKALQSDHEFELERLRCEHQETINQIKYEQEKTQIITTTIDVQTDQPETFDKQTSVLALDHQEQSTETNPVKYQDESIQTSLEQNDEVMRRSINKDQQTQFNLAIQRAVQNATQAQKKEIQQLEQQLADKRGKIIKLKECVQKLQNFYTLSSTPPPILPSVANSMITSSTDDEQQFNQDEQIITTTETTPTTTTNNRQAFFKRSEPIAMPSSFIVQSMLAAGNAASSPKT